MLKCFELFSFSDCIYCRYCVGRICLYFVVEVEVTNEEQILRLKIWLIHR